MVSGLNMCGETLVSVNYTFEVIITVINSRIGNIKKC